MFHDMARQTICKSHGRSWLSWLITDFKKLFRQLVLFVMYAFHMTHLLDPGLVDNNQTAVLI